MLKVIHNLTDTLLEVAIIYAVCLVLAALAFSWVEGETFIRSLYWAGISTTTTGYGDVTPKTVPGMALAFIVTHLSAFIIAPMVIVKLNQKMMKDENAFTNEEQEQIIQKLNAIEEKLK